MNFIKVSLFAPQVMLFFFIILLVIEFVFTYSLERFHVNFRGSKFTPKIMIAIPFLHLVLLLGPVLFFVCETLICLFIGLNFRFHLFDH